MKITPLPAIVVWLWASVSMFAQQTTGAIARVIRDQSARLLLTDPGSYPIERLLTHARWLLGQLQ